MKIQTSPCCLSIYSKLTKLDSVLAPLFAGRQPARRICVHEDICKAGLRYNQSSQMYLCTITIISATGLPVTEKVSLISAALGTHAAPRWDAHIASLFVWRCKASSLITLSHRNKDYESQPAFLNLKQHAGFSVYLTWGCESLHHLPTQSPTHVYVSHMNG